MSSAILRSLMTPLIAGLVMLALFSALLTGVVMAAGNSITSPDTAVFGVDWTSLVLDGSGNPVVSYHDGANDDLKLLHCGDPNCTSGNVVTSPDTVGLVGEWTSLALDASGNPVVSHYDRGNGRLKILHCGDPNCSSGNVITSPDMAEDGDTSLVLDSSGNPVVSYQGTHYGLKLLHCGDPNCTSGNIITSPDTTGYVGLWSSMALDATGNPVVSYLDNTNFDLKLLHCGDPNCSTGNSITSPDTGGDIGGNPSLALDATGSPVVSYFDVTNFDLKLLHCGDPNCTSGNSITSPDTVGFVGAWTSLALDGTGIPVVSYTDGTHSSIKVLHCGDPNCNSGNVITSSDPMGATAWASMMLDASGNPVVSYQGYSNGHLKILHCADAYCSPDSDGDGVLDPSDTCPTEVGSPTNGGCPFPPSIGGIVEVAAGSADSLSEHQDGRGHELVVRALFVALAAAGVAWVRWSRQRRRLG